MKSWKTSMGGVIILLCALAIVLRDPKSLTDPHVVGLLVAGVALIEASDHVNPPSGPTATA